jgi:hypothetical protein
MPHDHPTFLRPLILMGTVLVGGFVARAQCEPAWESVGGGVQGDVWSMVVFDDGTGPALYAGGQFRTAGGVPAESVARWDGTAWSAVGGGITGGSLTRVYVLAVFDDGRGPALYAGGDFDLAGGTQANNVARWDGTAWSPLGDGLSRSTGGVVYDAVVFDDGNGPALYVSGSFDTAGSVSARNIARWDGTAWAEVGGGVSHHLAAMEVFDDGSGPLLVAGGTFGTAGSVPAPWVAVWDGVAWAPPVGGGPNAHPGIGAMRIVDDGTGPELYIGGAFTMAGGVSARRVARWDGAAWAGVGDGVDDKVYALHMFDDGAGTALYIGGMFSRARGSSADHVARLDGNRWMPVGGGMNAPVWDFVVFDDGTGPALYAGGAFWLAGGFPAMGITRLTCAPPRCAADCDQSTGAGVLDIFDFLCFQHAFVTNNPYACDCDTRTGNGVCDMLDFLCFQQAFVAGCP